MTFDIKRTTAEIALPQMADNSVHLVVTDPPYFIHKMGDDWDKQGLDKSRNKAKTIGGMPVGMKFDPKQGQKLQKFMTPISQEIFRVLKPGGFYISFSQARLYHRMALAIEDSGFEIRDMLGWMRIGQAKAQKQEHHIWKKVKKGLLSESEAQFLIDSMGGRKTPQLGPGMEPMVLAMKPLEGTFVENWTKHETGLIDTSQKLHRRFPTNAMPFDRPNKAEKGEDNEHMTVKPVKLIEHLIRIFSKENQVVLDPFMGSGSHGVAAILNNRHFIGFDPVEEYIKTSRFRLEQAEKEVQARLIAPKE